MRSKAKQLEIYALVERMPDDELLTWEEAMESPEREDWKRAIEEECASIMANNTLRMMEQDETRENSIGSKWVFKQKYDHDAKHG